MTTTTAPISAPGTLTVVKHLAAGRDLDFVATACRLTTDQVRDIGSRHGYPDRAKLAWAADELANSADQTARDAIPAANHTDRTALTHRPPATATAAPPAVARVPAQPLPPAPGQQQPPRQFDATAALLLRGTESPAKRIRQLAQKISDQLTDLRDRLADEDRKRRQAERDKAAAAEAHAEVERLQQQLAEAKAKIRKLDAGYPSRGRRTPVRREQVAKARDGAGAHQRDICARHGVRLNDIRTWAQQQRIDVPAMSPRLKREVLDAYDAAHGGAGTTA